MNITLNEDNTVTRKDDNKLLAEVNPETREIEWKHWTFKKKYDGELITMLKSVDDVSALVPDEVLAEVVDAVENPVDDITNEGLNMLDSITKSQPEPAKSKELGDRTPGYPEWVLATKGQEAYEKQYHRYGKDRYTGKNLN